ncbi:MAG: GNAT family N-acetyltransferase [Hydrogenophaga sp.]|uniref:GNAT family N-acetyltransferase n=1 Tax=Hydrogenophaga sp. TaxID=1904254 RepID=UPI001D7A6A1E|nr:GNAT family N-acetyltransferase [Hydrogenophaga sp.]MBX3611408.1 GNAT family N-acetyltransferase [Hydrogenophaga sp.]
MSDGINWRCLPFDALSPQALYDLLRLRTEVFVIEQNCVFQDMDGADPACHHLLGTRDGALLAYARLVPAALKFPEASIGRVVSDPSTRGTGLGHRLMQEAVTQLQTLWGEQPVRIGAQAHLQGFYRQHGFEPDGPIYLEDGIDHIEMLRR